jgi:hypothetical protein
MTVNENESGSTSDSWWKTHSHYANWATVVIAGLVGLGTWNSYAHSQSSAQLTTQINDTVATDLKPFEQEFKDLKSQVDKIEGWEKGFSAKQQSLEQQQEKQGKDVHRLLALENSHRTRENAQEKAPTNKTPEKLLTAIRRQVWIARGEDQEIPSGELLQIKRDLQSLPKTEPDYWVTLAALINYQSFVNQQKGLAPNPSAISKPCGYLSDSMVVGQTFESCITVIDSNGFQNVTFRNSVVIYNGGDVSLKNVRFENCLFELTFDARKKVTPNGLLLALLESPDLITIKPGG